jgi:hypothetical protein
MERNEVRTERSELLRGNFYKSVFLRGFPPVELFSDANGTRRELSFHFRHAN